MRPRRTLALILGGALAGTAILGLADLVNPNAHVTAANPLFRTPVFQGYTSSRQDGALQGDGSTLLIIPGLWAETRTSLSLSIAARAEARRVRVFADDVQIADMELQPRLQTVVLEATASRAGTLALRIQGGRREGTAYRVAEVDIRQAGPRRVPGGRLLHYLLLGMALGFFLARMRPADMGAVAGNAPRPAGALSLRAAFSIVFLLLVGIGLALVLWRVQATLTIAALLPVLAAAGALSLVADAVSRASRCPRVIAWAIAALIALRFVSAWDPRSGSIDAEWHTHNLMSFASHQLIESNAPGVARSPYPPAFYAIASPFRVGDYATDVRMVRLLMAALDGLAPLWVFGIARALGLAPRAAGCAALMVAAVPESVLVLEKGIASNILGHCAMLATVLAFARDSTSALTRIALLSLMMLSHAATAVLGLCLLGTWWLLQAREDPGKRTTLARNCGLVAVAALLAWVVYYREVPLVFGDPSRGTTDARFLQPHGYRVGKIAQDLILKFGGAPVVLACLALRRGRLRSSPLLAAWAAVTLFFGAVAVLTPFPLRFEYFGVPLVGLACGLLCEAQPHRYRWILTSAAFAAALQVFIAVMWRYDRFEIIAVILESPRWPFPFRLSDW